MEMPKQWCDGGTGPSIDRIMNAPPQTADGNGECRMGKIILLDEKTSNQIAAGEVIERPASVVKEMVENAVDAGATQVSIEVRNGGISLIRIEDNGSGIDADDIEMAFERHGTSKLRAIEDLDSLETMGFRGEALASIASVSRLEVTTRTIGMQNGIHALVEAGRILEVSQRAATIGTRFIVRDLFYNTPARYKFLKKDATEAGYVTDAITRLALCHPDVSLKLSANGQEVFRTPGNGDLLSTIYSLYGRETAQELLQLDHEEKGVRVTGCVGKPAIARGTRARQTIMLNRRSIRNATVTAALDDAYRTLLMTRQYAFAVIHLSVSPAAVDVNVHPAKLEVRFSDEGLIFSAVNRAVKNALLKASLLRDQVLAVEAAASGAMKEGPGQKVFVHSNEKARVPVSPNSTGAMTPNGSGHTPVVYRTHPGHDDRHQHAGDPLPDWKQLYRPVSGIRTREPDTEVKAVGSETPPAMSGSTFDPPATRSAGTACVPDSDGSVLRSVQTLDTEGATAASPLQADAVALQVEAVASQVEAVAPQVEAVASRVEAVAPQVEPDAIPAQVEPDAQQTLEPSGLPAERVAARHWAGARIVGQVLDTYIVLETQGEMLMIDQHAAHERIRYETLRTTLETGEVPAQMLMQPLTVQVSDLEHAFISEKTEAFARVGFEVEPFGRGTVLLRALPGIYSDGLSPKEFLEIADAWMTDPSSRENRISDAVLHQMSCKGAIKANRHMGHREMQALVDQLAGMENPYTCVHGRPVILRFSAHELEKRFHRIV